MALTGEAAMQQKMKGLFSHAGMNMAFRKVQGGWWQVKVDGKELGYSRQEHDAFQEALDKSGIGGKISYTFNEKKREWVFRYSPKKEQVSGK